MSFQKNTSGQKWLVFAFDRTTNAPKTGDAANITAKIRKDYTSATATNDTNPDELEDGYYEFTLTQAETNATVVDILPESSTANIQVIGVPGRSFIVPTNFPTLGIASDGDLTKVNTLDGHTAQTADHTANIAAILADTNELQTDWTNGGRLDLILDARASQTSVDDVPTNAELATALGTADDATLAAIAALNNLSAAQVTTAATAATPVVTISGTLTTLDAIWNKIKAWLGALAGKTADAVTRAEINATTAGASYNETTDSQEALRDNYTTGGDTLIVAPIVATVPATVVRNSGTTQAFRYTPLPSGPLVIVDSAGAAIDLSTSDLKMICRNVTDPTDTFDLTLTDAELSVSGASHNYINVAYTPTVYGKYQRTTFRKPSGGVWAVIEIGHWQIEDGPNPA